MKKYIFGPQLIKLNVSNELVSELLETGLKQTNPYNKVLAGKIENEFGFSVEDKNKFSKKIEPYIEQYINELQKDKNNKIFLKKKIQINSNKFTTTAASPRMTSTESKSRPILHQCPPEIVHQSAQLCQRRTSTRPL